MKAVKRGFTLIELLVSMAIMMIGVAAACVIFVNGAALQANADNLGDAQDAARLAMNTVAMRLQSVGAGVSGGLYANIGSPAALTWLAPVSGWDGTAGTVPTAVANQSDDLWLVVPHWNANRESCIATGASTTLSAAVAPGGGPLPVQCAPVLDTSDPLTGNDIFVVTNLLTGGLLTHVTVSPASGPTPAKLNFAESAVAGFADSPQRGYQLGDTAYQVSLVHYFVTTSASGVPGLYASTGCVQTTSGCTEPSTAPYPVEGRPLFDTSSGALIQSQIEDLQVAYGFDTGTGNPMSYNWVTNAGLAMTYASSTAYAAAVGQLRSVRISVVARTKQSQKDSRGVGETSLASLAPLPLVENHASAAGPDGYARVMLTRTFDLPNLAPANL